MERMELEEQMRRNVLLKNEAHKKGENYLVKAYQMQIRFLKGALKEELEKEKTND